jgi:hypothetical protein
MEAKKPRSQAQIDAFEKARAARENNLKRKWQAEQEAQKQHVPEPEQEVKPEEEQQPVDTEAETPPTTPVAPSKAVSQQEDDHDIIDFDPDSFRDELYEKLHATTEELKQLKEHVHGLKSKHEELESSWHQHGVRSAHALNFV